MKLPESLQPKRLFAKPSKDRRGVALVTVLTVMALTTILVLTFFSLATSEHRASSVYSNGLQAQQVAEQAVNMVIAQIREATVVPQGTLPWAWASQPGAIRVWDIAGKEKDAYKLYSDDEMKTAQWQDFEKDFSDAQNWSSRPEHYVDLNEPVIRGQKVYYPIVNPLASTMPKWPKPLGNDDSGVEGFRFNEDGMVLSDEGAIGRKAAQVAKAEGHVAMPVRWIYQLADGTLGVLEDSASGGGATGPGYKFKTISGGGTPSKENPMVARFAFWADDETSKLNMNTHAGGLAWDIPKAGGELDMAMGKYQPAQKEWQRYPGHPATTHLIPALAPGVLDIVNDRDAMEMLYRVVPRVVGGGSESGTRVINTRDPKEQNGLIADTEPLFPSLDDVIMRSDREPHEFPDAKGNPIPADEMSEYLERAKFFVTVNSRASETNLFNKPRIAMWPVYNADYSKPTEYNRYLTPFDQLIHYCASLGKAAGGTSYPRYEYIFRREKADSATFDYDGISRNKQLIAYLNYLMTADVPGYGSSFADKYGEASTRQLVTMIFDYIRSTNLHDDTLFDDFTEAFQKENTTNHVTFTNPRDIDEKGFGHKGHGQVSPILINDGGVETKGMGRFYSISGADIHVSCVGMPEPIENALYPGVTQYNRGIVEAPSGTVYPNLPPLPINVTKDPMTKPAWPQWLKDLEMSNPAEFQAAFEPDQWNWSLAFLDPAYASAVLANPSLAKFNRSLITLAGCERMRLQPDERLMQAAFLFNMFCPSIGWGSINPDMEVHIRREGGSGMTFQGLDGNVGFLGFEGKGALGGDTYIWATNWAKPHRQGGARSWGGLLSFGYMLSARQGLQEGSSQANERNLWFQMGKGNNPMTLNTGIRCRLTPIDKGYNQIETGLGMIKNRKVSGNNVNDIAQAYRYDLVTIPFKIRTTEGVKFDRGTVNFKVFNGGKHTENSAREGDAELVQDATIDFPDFSVAAPVMTAGWMGYINEFNSLSHDSHHPVEMASLTADPGNPLATAKTKATRRSGTGRTAQQSGTQANRGRMAHAVAHWDSGATYIRPGDVVQSVGIGHGDMRIAAAMKVITPADEVFTPHHYYGKRMMAHSLTTSAGVAIQGYDPYEDTNYLLVPDLPANKNNPPYRNVIPLAIMGDKDSKTVQRYGDFDNGAGTMVDGPYINKPDEGNVHSLKTRFTQEVVDYWESRRNYGEFPYFSNPDIAEAGGPAYFSPNRIISGPGMLGSLPSSLKTTPPKPWQTLLFRPNVDGNGYSLHPGGGGLDGNGTPKVGMPPDHLIMDLFWMPVVEPYAISEPLSTGGKVNMNYEIVPFLHVHRDTALRGVFRSEFMLCVPNQWHHSYKHDHGRGRGYHWRDNPYGGALQGVRLRTAIVEDDTLVQFSAKRFQKGRDIFKSATEICEIHLIPEEVAKRLGNSSGSKGSIGTYTPKVDPSTGSVPEMENGKYWRDHSLVGDNSRERPYTNIHTRLTTKSNTYQVHYRAQVIKQSRRDNDSDYGEWRPYVDSVQAEYRGSSMVERYVDPNDDLLDFATDLTETVDKYYQFRVTNPRRFAP
ncbi:MAG: Verru_Chthon cassette protein A [Verrucomicrobiae bacterium]|nr:Verru_Chthon cassette protein A [Verrucomicrobiae bacterium]